MSGLREDPNLTAFTVGTNWIKGKYSNRLDHYFSENRLVAVDHKSNNVFDVKRGTCSKSRSNFSTQYVTQDYVRNVLNRKSPSVRNKKKLPNEWLAVSTASVKSIQSALNALGFGVGTADGIAGPKTRKGLRSFARSRSLTYKGPTAELISALEGESKTRASKASQKPQQAKGKAEAKAPVEAIVEKPNDGKAGSDSDGQSRRDRLIELKRLVDGGLITEAEAEAKRKEILGDL